MTKISGIVFLLFCSLSSYAHRQDEAYFTIEQKNDFVEVKAEFSWFLRNALWKAFPNLKDSKRQADYDDALFLYVQENLRLYNSEDQQLSIRSFTELKHRELFQEGQFLLVFTGNNVAKIRNTLMFDLDKQQRNFHIIKQNDKTIHFVSTFSHPEFVILSSKNQGFNTIWYGLGAALLIIIGLITNKLLKKKSV